MGVPRLNVAHVRELRCPVTPLKEQRRIVAKLEALRARGSRAREAVAAVPRLLENLRQSILAAAFRGDLTKDWRAKHEDFEPATDLLKHIRIERRRKWEETDSPSHVFTAEAYAGQAEADIEDILGNDLYLALVNACYGLKTKQMVAACPTGTRVVKHVEDHFRTLTGAAEFDHFTRCEPPPTTNSSNRVSAVSPRPSEVPPSPNPYTLPLTVPALVRVQGSINRHGTAACAGLVLAFSGQPLPRTEPF